MMVLSTACTTYQNRDESQHICEISFRLKVVMMLLCSWNLPSRLFYPFFVLLGQSLAPSLTMLHVFALAQNLKHCQNAAICVRKSTQLPHCCCQHITSGLGCFYDPVMVMVRHGYEVSQPSAASYSPQLRHSSLCRPHTMDTLPPHFSQNLIGCYYYNKLKQPHYGCFVLAQIQYGPIMCNRGSTGFLIHTWRYHHYQDPAKTINNLTDLGVTGLFNGQCQVLVTRANLW